MSIQRSAGSGDKRARVTIAEVAAAAHVSIMTVSRTLSGKGYVSDETRRRVEQAIDELGYVANIGARALKGGRTGVLGMLVGACRDKASSLS